MQSSQAQKALNSRQRFLTFCFVCNAGGWGPWMDQVHHSLPRAFHLLGPRSFCPHVCPVTCPVVTLGHCHHLSVPARTYPTHSSQIWVLCTSLMEEEEGAAGSSHCWSWLEAPYKDQGLCLEHVASNMPSNSIVTLVWTFKDNYIHRVQGYIYPNTSPWFCRP